MMLIVNGNETIILLESGVRHTGTAVSVSLVFQQHRQQFCRKQSCFRYTSESLLFQPEPQHCQSVWCFKNIAGSFLCIVRCPARFRYTSESLLYQPAPQQCQLVWCFKNIVGSFLNIVRCPECTGTAVSFSLVFKQHRQQFSVYSPVSTVHRDSSIRQSGVSTTSSAVLSPTGLLQIYFRKSVVSIRISAVSVSLVFQ